MVDSIQVQIDKVRASISMLDSQRNTLGDDTVNTALAALKQQLSALEQQASALAPAAEERRMVTILFADIVGSTSIAEQLDPEEWRQYVTQIHTTLGSSIASHHGTVAQYLGDGLLAFFGSRQASEHDPENAIRAALDGQSAIANLQFPVKINLRVGIHTGLVVVGDLGDMVHKEFTASGDAMNLAARLQSAAPPGGILISHDTYRYVRGVFDMTPNPPLVVKGKREPLQTYLVRRAKPRPFRSVTRGVAGIETRTMGRDVEIQALQAAYLKAYEQRQVVWAQLLGDPGIGKSRLLEDVTDWLDLRGETFRLLRARAFPDDTNQPFSLIRRLWFDRFQITEDAPLEQAESRWVERFREFYERDDDEAAHALGLLVGLSFENSPHVKGMRNDPTQVKGRALVVSRELISTMRQSTPLIVLLKDLQWADQASWEYLTAVLLDESINPLPHGMFILGAARPEWEPPVNLSTLFNAPAVESAQISATLINLGPLSDQATRQLATELFQRIDAVPESILDLLVERSEGVPYYTEEIFNWFIDHGIIDTHDIQWCFYPERLKDQPLPATLQHLLLTRLSSLSPEELAALQRGAIFGRNFWTGGVTALGVTSVDETFGLLQPRGFVDSQPDSAFQGDNEWSFHHNLLHAVTYESVLKRERAALHKVAGEWLEQQARQSGRLDEFASLLGDHFERAGELSFAANWYILAGNRAMNQGAPREARDFFAQALDLLPPADLDRRWQALLGQEKALSVLGDASPWKEATDALINLASSFEDQNYLAEACLRRAVCWQRSGNTSESEQMAAMWETLEISQRCGNEAIEAKALALLSMEEYITGDLTASRQHIDKALQLARQLADENLLSFVLFRAAYSESRDFPRRCQFQLEQIELDHRLGNRLGEANGLGNLGSSYLTVGQYKIARPILEQARRINEALGARRSLAYNLGTLANLHRDTGDLRTARRLIDQGLQDLAPSQDSRGLVMGWVGYGVILFEMGDIPNAVARFSAARDLAENKGMLALQSEAEVSLAACAIQKGSLDEGRSLMEMVWNRYPQHSYYGMSQVGWFFRAGAENFDALGDTDTCKAFLEAALTAYNEVVELIREPEWIQSFSETPDNRILLEMWDRYGVRTSK